MGYFKTGQNATSLKETTRISHDYDPPSIVGMDRPRSLKKPSLHKPQSPTPSNYDSGCALIQVNYYGFRYYDPVTGRWPSRDPIGELGSVIIGYDFNFESTIKLWLYREYATVLNLYHYFQSTEELISKEMLDRYNEAFVRAYLYLEYFDAKMARAFSKGSFEDLNLNLFLGNDPLNWIDLFGFKGTQGRARRAAERRSQNGRAPSGPSAPNPSTASTAGSVAQQATQPKTTTSPSALGGAVSKVGGAAVGMGVQTTEFMSDSQNYKDVTKAAGGVTLRNQYLNGEITFEEYQDKLRELNQICK